MDETGLWTAQNKGHDLAKTLRRGLAGMGGRSIETTNAWNPAELSAAQMAFEAKADGHLPRLSQAAGQSVVRNKAERRKIHKHVYGDSWWVDLDGIEAEAAEIMESDPANAERFFGNRVVAGSSNVVADWSVGRRRGLCDWLPEPPAGTPVCARLRRFAMLRTSRSSGRDGGGYRSLPVWLG